VGRHRDRHLGLVHDHHLHHVRHGWGARVPTGALVGRHEHRAWSRVTERPTPDRVVHGHEPRAIVEDGLDVDDVEQVRHARQHVVRPERVVAGRA